MHTKFAIEPNTGLVQFPFKIHVVIITTKDTAEIESSTTIVARKKSFIRSIFVLVLSLAVLHPNNNKQIILKICKIKDVRPKK